MRAAMLALSLVLVGWSPEGAMGENIDVDGVPLPADAAVDTGASLFAGAWAGKFDGALKTILVVEKLPTGEGDGSAIYAVGDNPRFGVEATAWRMATSLSDHRLVVNGRVPVTYTASPTGRLRGVYGDGYGFAVLAPYPLGALLQGGGAVTWSGGGERVMLDVGLEEDGAAVALEAVIYTPPGEGPFALALVNHGSTGAGTDAGLAKQTWANAWMADVLNARGYIVAFVQRRGRGRSGGRYDEGFGADRAAGYTCEPGPSLAGAERALTDIEAAVAALRARGDVAPGPVLMLGHSRGGALSVAYAGRHPDDVAGVVNFAGGWMGDICPTADQINGTLFNSGAAFKGPTLWLYGEDDAYYSNATPARLRDGFEAAGGNATLLTFHVRGENNGHYVMSIPPLWDAAVAGYLDALR